MRRLSSIFLLLVLPMLGIVSACTDATRDQITDVVNTPMEPADPTTPDQPTKTVGTETATIVGQIVGKVTGNPVIGVAAAGAIVAVLGAVLPKKKSSEE